MPKIIPISDLNDPERLSEMCAQTNEPIFITENSSCNIVVMSMDVYNKTILMQEEYSKLAEAEITRLKGEPTFSVEEARNRLKEKYSNDDM